MWLNDAFCGVNRRSATLNNMVTSTRYMDEGVCVCVCGIDSIAHRTRCLEWWINKLVVVCRIGVAQLEAKRRQQHDIGPSSFR